MPRLLGFILALISFSLGIGFSLGIIYLAQLNQWPRVPIWVLALLSGVVSMLITWRLLPAWWRPVLLILPLAALFSLSINSWWWLFAAILLLAFQWNAIFTRIPLYRSDAMVAEVLMAYMQRDEQKSLLDLGCGDGRLLWRMAKAQPESQFVGIESAPMLYLIARWRCRNQPNCRIEFGDFWPRSWADFDVVFAFLSPEPMLPVWRKRLRESGEGAVLVSLAFLVPGIEPSELLPAQQFDMYLYRADYHAVVGQIIADASKLAT
ncbi:MAG: methyltransferase domain-containing protein [Halothiobacillus sp.]